MVLWEALIVPNSSRFRISSARAASKFLDSMRCFLAALSTSERRCIVKSWVVESQEGRDTVVLRSTADAGRSFVLLLLSFALFVADLLDFFTVELFVVAVAGRILKRANGVLSGIILYKISSLFPLALGWTHCRPILHQSSRYQQRMGKK